MSEHDNLHDETENDTASRILPKVGVAVLVIIAGIAIAYGYHQQSVANDMTARDSALNASVLHLQSQLDATTAKMNDMAAQAAAAAQAQAAQTAATSVASKKHTASASDKRIKALQARLDEQQKALTDTNNAITQTRSDLQASLDSTRTDLNGAIAKNHDELVALEKRGQRDYFEFDLTKSKHFSRTGPISLSLRKVDAKHLHYDLALLIDDNRLTKKNVVLYEPVWISREDDPQPVQIVVNKINKDSIHGYVSTPKYRKSELAATANTPTMTPVSATTSAPNRAPEPPPSSPAPPAGLQDAPVQP